jgi:Glyoxalase-like domain
MRLKVDHVTVCGSDLVAMRRSFAEAGLATTYGGPHANGVTHMDLLAFPDGSYLELIAPVRPLSGGTGMMPGWAPLMAGNAGAGAWAVQSFDIRGDAARLRAAGIEVRGPEAGGRERRDGAGLEWETAMVGPGAAGSVLPFLIQDKTARSLRVPPADGVTEVSGVAKVVIAVREIERSAALFRRAFGWEGPDTEEHPDFGAALAHFPETPVILATPLRAGSWLHERLERFLECPVAFLLSRSIPPDAASRLELDRAANWFGRKLAWWDQRTLQGTRLGVIE